MLIFRRMNKNMVAMITVVSIVVGIALSASSFSAGFGPTHSHDSKITIHIHDVEATTATCHNHFKMDGGCHAPCEWTGHVPLFTKTFATILKVAWVVKETVPGHRISSPPLRPPRPLA